MKNPLFAACLYACAFPNCVRVSVFRAALNMEGSKCARCDGKWPGGWVWGAGFELFHYHLKEGVREETLKATVAPSVPASLPSFRPVISAYSLSRTHMQTHDISLQTLTPSHKSPHVYRCALTACTDIWDPAEHKSMPLVSTPWSCLSACTVAHHLASKWNLHPCFWMKFRKIND